MAEKRVKEIIVYLSYEKFRVFSRKTSMNINEMKKLRDAFSKEKARILYTIKTQKPNSIYQLAKLLGRDPKAVKKDLKILQQAGIVTLTAVRGERRLKPELNVDEINVKIII
ncbi:MAG: HTH domain-containing protein [Candidatus Pacearchaeota archaeon]